MIRSKYIDLPKLRHIIERRLKLGSL
jgi:hypothetical protein